MNQSRTLILIIFQIVILLISNIAFNNNHTIALQSPGDQNAIPTTIAKKLPQTDTSNNNISTSKKFTLIAGDKSVLRISPDNALHPGGILYRAMTFNGTIPGPVIVVNQGDVFEITLQNRGELVHSLDLHGIEGPSHALISYVKPGESKTLKVKAENCGIFMYHCHGDNLNGIWDHIASGMYGGIVVHSKNERPAKEFYIVFGEIYNIADTGLLMNTSSTVNSYGNDTDVTHGGTPTKNVIGSFDMNKFLANKPDLILTNGMAYRYMPFFRTVNKIILDKDAEVFKVKPGELTRWYIINAGPRGYLSFNFASGMISTVFDGNNNLSTHDDDAITHFNTAGTSSPTLASSSKIYEISIPPGSAEEIEAIFPEEGSYVRNDHDIGRFFQGAGFVVLATNSPTPYDHPKGTWIPPYR